MAEGSSRAFLFFLYYTACNSYSYTEYIIRGIRAKERSAVSPAVSFYSSTVCL